jgi:hypothetical protein
MLNASTSSMFLQGESQISLILFYLCTDHHCMTPARVALTVAIGTAIGLYIDFPHAPLEGYLVIAAVHGCFAWFVGLLVATGMKILGFQSNNGS